MGIVVPTISSARASLMPLIPLIPRSDKARLIDLLGRASLLAGILGSTVNDGGERTTCSEFVECYFLEVFCKVESCEGADGTAADDGNALVRGRGHSFDGGSSCRTSFPMLTSARSRTHRGLPWGRGEGSQGCPSSAFLPASATPYRLYRSP